MKCGDLMSRNIRWVQGNASVREAAEVMRDQSLGILLVFEPSPPSPTPGQLMGVVTDRDLALRACTQDRSPNQLRVADVATTSVVVCREDEGLTEAEDRMREAQKERLVVLAESGEPVGILSLTDILLHDHAGRALRTARGVLSREAGGAHTPVEQIQLTASTPEDEEVASRQESVTVGRVATESSMREFPP